MVILLMGARQEKINGTFSKQGTTLNYVELGVCTLKLVFSNEYELPDSTISAYFCVIKSNFFSEAKGGWTVTYSCRYFMN